MDGVLDHHNEHHLAPKIQTEYGVNPSESKTEVDGVLLTIADISINILFPYNSPTQVFKSHIKPIYG